jgi:hypothetical protein
MKHWKKAPPIIGNVYWLYNFTAPKVWTGKHFECLLTDQIILKGQIRTRTEVNIMDWPGDIYNIERFNELIPHTKPE